MKAAKRACQLVEGNSDLRAEALNKWAFVPLCAWILKRHLLCFYRFLKEGGNEIEHLISDVGMMKICSAYINE